MNKGQAVRRGGGTTTKPKNGGYGLRRLGQAPNPLK